MSGKVTGWVWDIDLDHAEAWVLMALADHAEHDGSKVYPSVARLVWKTGYSRTWVKDILKRLIHEHEILVLVKKGGGRGNPNEYRIDMSAGKRKQPFDEWLAEQKGNSTTPSKNGQSQEKGHSKSQKGSVQSDPETSVLETSGSRRESDDSQPSAPQEKTPEQINWFDVYAERCKDYGFAVSDEDRNRHAGNLRRLVMLEGATHAEMNRVIGKILDDKTRNYIISPQEALNKVRGVPTSSGQGQEPSRRSKQWI